MCSMFQADVLHELNTRIVVPLLPPARAPLPAKRLNPMFTIGDEPMSWSRNSWGRFPVSCCETRSPASQGRMLNHACAGHGACRILSRTPPVSMPHLNPQEAETRQGASEAMQAIRRLYLPAFRSAR